MALEELSTVDGVVTALGGPHPVAKKTRNVVSAVYNWRKDGKFPADTYVLLKDELEKIGKTAPDSLWKMRTAEAAS